MVNPVSYRFRLPLTYRISLTFHISLLKPVHERQQNDPATIEPPPPLNIDGDPTYWVRVLLNYPWVRNHLQHLVDWEGLRPRGTFLGRCCGHSRPLPDQRVPSCTSQQASFPDHTVEYQEFGSLGYTIMGKTADLTVVQKTIIDNLHKEDKPQTFISKEAGCSQSAVSKHVNRKLSGRKKCGRKRCTTNRENRSLMRIVKQNPFKNLSELHKE
ncbi:hypothetical protein QTP86_010938 [Hemibagrus guttatus]|nr:hypothetical protein QTP86_010938 [Hemibagrus guttatus]